MLQSKVVCSPYLSLKPVVLTETVTIIFVMQHVEFYPVVSFYKWIYITMNCREKYEELIDHHSYTHSSSSCEIKAWKKIQVWMGLQPMTSGIPVQCSINWALFIVLFYKQVVVCLPSWMYTEVSCFHIQQILALNHPS